MSDQELPTPDEPTGTEEANILWHATRLDSLCDHGAARLMRLLLREREALKETVRERDALLKGCEPMEREIVALRAKVADLTAKRVPEEMTARANAALVLAGEVEVSFRRQDRELIPTMRRAIDAFEDVVPDLLASLNAGREA